MRHKIGDLVWKPDIYNKNICIMYEHNIHSWISILIYTYIWHAGKKDVYLFILKSYLYTIIFIINNKLWWLYLSFPFLSDIKVVASLENLWWLRCNINCNIGHILYWCGLKVFFLMCIHIIKIRQNKIVRRQRIS